MGIPISNVTRRVVYAASGTGPYNFTFEILAAGDVAVFRDDTLLTLTTDYTVTINANGTGFITLVAAPTGATQIAIVGNRTIQRTTDFVTGGDFFANTVNAEMDQQTIFAQQNAEGLARAMQAPQTDPTNINMTLPRASVRAGKYLSFDDNGNPVAAEGRTEVAAVYAIRDDIVAVSAIDDQVVAVAGNETNIDTVAGISSNVTTVAGIAANVTTVAGISANVTSVAGNAADITTVAGSIANVNNVGGSIAAVNAVNSNATNINTVAGQITPTNNVSTVAGISANVATVAGISANVTTVATNNSNVTTVATNIANVNSVGSNISNVNNVAGNATNINTVAGISSNVTTVAGVSANVTTVAGNNANVTTVASNIASVNTTALNIGSIISNQNNMAAIQGASANAATASAAATTATTQATNAAASAAAASAVVLGNEPVRPLVRPSLLLDFANTRQLDPRITFTRASTATFYDGRTVAKAEENLLTQSQEFNVALGTNWFLAGSGVTAVLNNAVAPDGTTTADTITITTADTGVRQSLAFANGLTYSISVFVRSVSGATGFTADLQNSQTSPSLTLTSSWQRFTWTVTASAARAWLDFQLNGAGSFEIWGAQVEQRSSVTAYTATTTAPITNYIPALQTAAAGVPRFEHDPVTGVSLGLEIEEQRTNLVLRSEEFEAASWGKNGVITVTANTVIAPDGLQTADTLTRNAAGTSNYADLTQSISVGAGGNVGRTYTASIWLRTSSGTTTVRLAISDVNFNTMLSGPLTVTSQWQRFTFTTSGPSGNWNAGGSNIGFALNMTSNSTVFAWGSQMEIGAFATSYIPTVASQVTRSADSAVMTGTNFSSWYRADEGTFYASVSMYGRRSGYEAIAAAHVGTSQNGVILGTQGPGGGSKNYVITNGSVVADLTSGTISLNTEFKTALAYRTNDFASSFNAGTVQTDTSGALAAGVDRLTIGNEPTVSPLGGIIRKIAFYPARVTNAQLQAMTTV